ADAPGLGGAADRFNRLFDHVVAEHDLDFHFGEKIDDVFSAAIKLRVPLLPAEALGLGDGYSLQSDLLQRFLHFIQFEWLDDRFDFFHRVSSPPLPGVQIRFGIEPWLAGPVPRHQQSEKCCRIRELWHDTGWAAKAPERPSPAK